MKKESVVMGLLLVCGFVSAEPRYVVEKSSPNWKVAGNYVYWAYPEKNRYTVKNTDITCLEAEGSAQCQYLVDLADVLSQNFERRMSLIRRLEEMDAEIKKLRALQDEQEKADMEQVNVSTSSVWFPKYHFDREVLP